MARTAAELEKAYEEAANRASSARSAKARSEAAALAIQIDEALALQRAKELRELEQQAAADYEAATYR